MKKFLCMLLAAALLLLSVGAVAEEEKVLNIFTWEGYIDEETLADFTAETGIKINWSGISSNEEQLVKLKKRVWILGISLFFSVALVIALAHPAANYFIRKYHLRPGQNYSTITPSTAAAEPEETTVVTELTEATEDPLAGFAD